MIEKKPGLSRGEARQTGKEAVREMGRSEARHEEGAVGKCGGTCECAKAPQPRALVGLRPPALDVHSHRCAMRDRLREGCPGRCVGVGRKWRGGAERMDGTEKRRSSRHDLTGARGVTITI